uniref:Uncharacterized protein n=1 Tax=viral metagenome TaxID=1070528 RepID=A0A6C0HJV2_9ZZZZ
MPHISSILVGTAQGCSTTGYVAPQKKLSGMDSSDLLKIQKLRALARSTTVSSINTSTPNNGGYAQLLTVQYANRVSVPLCVGRF